MQAHLNILIIDDDEVSNYIAVENLELMDHEARIHTCLNGEEAVNYLKEILNSEALPVADLPDVIFLDVNMPKMNAFQFLAEYVKLDLRGKDIIIVLLLGTPLGEEDMAGARRFNDIISTYVEKPLNNVLLSNIVKNHLMNTQNGKSK